MFEQTTNTSYKPAEYSEEYLNFGNPEEYLKVRKGKLVLGSFRRWFEMRAIYKCLENLPDIHSVCDIPCGAGTLFPCWRKKGYRVVGADLSDRMIGAAGNMLKHLNLEGRAIQCNAFTLKNCLKEDEVDLIASVRFFYYFKKDKRIELLQTMGELSRKYLLVQYKTRETRKGRINLKRLGSNTQRCSMEEIREELRVAHLDCIKILAAAPAGSDRVFVTAANRK